MLLMPDLFAYWLTARIAAERTNASTTGLLDPRTRAWDRELIAMLGLPAGLVPELTEPGTPLGPILPAVAATTGLSPGTVVTTVGSHDTASAVVAVPAEGDAFAYISCGTWALVGVEPEAPVLTEASRPRTSRMRAASTVRPGSSATSWACGSSRSRSGPGRRTAGRRSRRVLRAAAALPSGGVTIDPDQPDFLAPGDMPRRIGAAVRAAGGPDELTRPELVRCILDSLAGAFARAVQDAARLSGRRPETVHLVGGGAHNDLLCQIDGRCLRAPGRRGPDRGHGDRQHPRPGAGARFHRGRPRGASWAGPRDPAPPPLRADGAGDGAGEGSAG